MNRIRKLLCGHERVRVVDYGDDYRWIVRCVSCSELEHWTGREVRGQLAPAAADLISVTPEPLDLLS